MRFPPRRRRCGWIIADASCVLAVLASGLALLAMHGCAATPSTSVQGAAVRLDRDRQVQQPVVRTERRTEETIDPQTGRVTGRATSEVTTTTGAQIAESARGEARGASATAVGDTLRQQIAGTAPTLGIDGATGSGGETSADTSAERLRRLTLPVLIGSGVIALIAAGGALYLGLRRAALIAAAVGAVLVLVGVYPAVLWLALAACVAALAGLYVWSERRGRTMLEALRAVVDGVEQASAIDAESTKVVKESIKAQADMADRVTIDRVRRLGERA